MKITKTQLKEMIHEIMMEISEDETKTIVTKKEKEGPKSATTDIQTNPYEDEDTGKKGHELFNSSIEDYRKWINEEWT